MRYFIKPKGAVLDWLLNQDARPSVLPDFDMEESEGLVVAHLLSGSVLAEVLPSPQSLPVSLAPGLPLGRLYFRVPKDKLISVCPALSDRF